LNGPGGFSNIQGRKKSQRRKPGIWYIEETRGTGEEGKALDDEREEHPYSELTFIILARSSVQEGLDIPTADDVARMKMIGDVNMFFKDEGEVECEIMIAERDYRRKGYGLEALRLLFRYATDQTTFSSSSSLPVPTPFSPRLPVNPALVVRVGASNRPSIALFHKLGFSVSKHVEVFDEVEMKFAWDSNSSQHLDVDKWVSSWTPGDEELTGLRKLSI